MMLASDLAGDEAVRLPIRRPFNNSYAYFLLAGHLVTALRALNSLYWARGLAVGCAAHFYGYLTDFEELQLCSSAQACASTGTTTRVTRSVSWSLCTATRGGSLAPEEGKCAAAGFDRGTVGVQRDWVETLGEEWSVPASIA